MVEKLENKYFELKQTPSRSSIMLANFNKTAIKIINKSGFIEFR